MKIITINKSGNYIHHGISYTKHNGYQGTSDNKMGIKRAILYEYYKSINDNEEFIIKVNDKYLKDKAIFKKTGFNDLELLNY